MKKTAKAAIFSGPNTPFEIREYEILPPPAGYAGIELIASGVCGTDVHMHTGKLGATPGQIIGHEFIGKVDAISDEDSAKCNIKVGDNVIVDIAIPCGKCQLCLAGDDANCVNMGVTNGGLAEVAPHFHGGYAEYSFAPITNLIKIPESVAPDAACVCACPGPTAIHAFSLAERAHCDMSGVHTAVVQGIGPVGSFAITYLKKALKIDRVIALTVFTDEKKNELMKQLGADEVIQFDPANAEEVQNSIVADLVFEASGSPAAVPMGINMLRNRGIYLVPGQYSNSGGIEIQPQLITFKALQIIGSSQYSMCDVEKYVKFLDEHKELIPILRSLATCYKVDEVNNAFDDAKAHKNVKTVLVK